MTGLVRLDAPGMESGAPMSRLGMGCSRIGSIGNGTDVQEIRRTIALALSLGVTVFDTADIYGQGDSERILGSALKSHRDEAVIITKVGRLFSNKMRLLRPLKPILAPIIRRLPSVQNRVVASRDGEMTMDFSPTRLANALDDSLRRLQTDVVDGLLLHSPPPAVAGDPAVGTALAKLRAAGKVRHFGVACDDYATLELALGIPGLTLLEVPLNVLDEAAASGLSGQMRARGIRVIAREVIRLQPHLSPSAAIANALEHRDATTVVVGLSSRRNLREAVTMLGQSSVA